MNSYQTTLDYTLSNGEEIDTRTGRVLFNLSSCTFFNQSTINWMRRTVIQDQELLREQLITFRAGQPQPLDARWGIDKNDTGYGKHFYTDGGVERIINELRADPNSRRAVLFVPGNTDYVPCWMSFSFHIKQRRLGMLAHARSVDLINGLPSDLIIFNSALRDIANALAIEPGAIGAAMGNPHIYLSDVVRAEELVKVK